MSHCLRLDTDDLSICLGIEAVFPRVHMLYLVVIAVLRAKHLEVFFECDVAKKPLVLVFSLFCYNNCVAHQPMPTKDGLNLS